MKLTKLLFTLISLCFFSCNSQETKHKYTNELINETSPYLLQHAHNPVKWHAWNNETLEKAKKENKLILVSIGYSACHWCHVMEHQSFENEEVAEIMNANFINIKVDREERPDVDQVYMTAVQMMTGSGGWPLNSIALPNGKPVWGGTYFPKEKWTKILLELSDLYKKEPQKLEKFSLELEKGIQQNSLVKIAENPTKLSNETLDKLVKRWESYFDTNYGGMNKSPKFPMPTNYQFLLRYAHQTNNKKLMKYVNTTLTKMAQGGIYDQVGGGFARYSTDKKWHIPHFEKMLYDNGQLLSLYSDAYLATKNELYKETVERTITFLERELLDKSGGFNSSLDADSMDKHQHLEEGAFYVWTKDELQKLIPDFKLFSSYYNVNSFGKWEENKYNLIRNKTDEEFAKQNKISEKDLKNKVIQWNETLLKKRSKRSRPRLDDKILTAWNGLVIKGYCDAYKATQNKKYLKTALSTAKFIEKNMMQSDGKLLRNYKNGKANINAFLQDYATVINGFIELYQVTFDEQWLNKANKLTTYCLTHFHDKKSGFFFYTSDEDTKLITKTIETTDGVIPSSNAMMANNLFLLSHYFENKDYKSTSKKIIDNISDELYSYPTSRSEWLQLHLNYTRPFYEIAITGKDYLLKNKELSTYYLPNKLVVGAKKSSNLALLKNRFTKGKTTIFVCQERVCLLPTENVRKSVSQMKK